MAKRKKKRNGLFRFLRVVVVVAALLFLLVFGAVNLAYGKLTYEPVPDSQEKPSRSDGVVHILLIGNDSRQNGADGRSDAMILLSVNPKTNRIQMTSLLRDMYVEIPGHEGNRLNAAYAYGGPALLMETVEQNLGIEVRRYVQVNFEAFASLVDAVGGVDLDLTNEEVKWVNGYLVEYNMLTQRPEGTDYLDENLSGTIHLNGPQALAYSRNRYVGTDCGRTQRQRKVLSAVLERLPRAFFAAPATLMDGVLSQLTTNLTRSECMGLILQAGRAFPFEIVQCSIPIDGSWQSAKIRGMEVLQVDFEANREFLRESLYGEK